MVNITASKRWDPRNPIDKRCMKISVITVCFRAEKTIAKTIESVKRQTYADVEYIIVDGASTDGTMEIIERTLGDYPAKIVSEPDRGIYDAMNKGIAMAEGDYLHFLNAGMSIMMSACWKRRHLL